jgi:hypothetical protein
VSDHLHNPLFVPRAGAFCSASPTLTRGHWSHARAHIPSDLRCGGLRYGSQVIYATLPRGDRPLLQHETRRCLYGRLSVWAFDRRGGRRTPWRICRAHVGICGRSSVQDQACARNAAVEVVFWPQEKMTASQTLNRSTWVVCYFPSACMPCRNYNLRHLTLGGLQQPLICPCLV